MRAYTVPYGGERLDRIAKIMLQTEADGAVVALLEANPGLADLASSGVVPGGTAIQPPADFRPAVTAPVILAWE